MIGNRLEQQLLSAGYEIMYTVSASRVECSICHPDWVTPNPYASRVLPTGQSETAEGALAAAMRNDGSLLISSSLARLDAKG